MKQNRNQPVVWRTAYASCRFYPKHLWVVSALLMVLVVVALSLLNSGRNAFGLETVLSILWNPAEQAFAGYIIWEIRLPRLINAMFAGAALGVSGAVFQSISRNPLGSPDIIGFTTGAASGAIFYIIFIGESNLGIAFSAIGGGMATALLVYLLSMKFGTVGSYRLILIGIGVGATLLALNGLMLVKGDLDSAMAANVWLAGSLNARQWAEAIPLMIGVLIFVPLIWAARTQLDLIEMGDDLAQQLGVNVQLTRLTTTFYAVVLASLATAAVGPIAFIALAAPQLARRLMGAKGIVVFASALMGALLLMMADLIGQLVPLQVTLPIGLMTAFIGGLYLLWMIGRLR